MKLNLPEINVETCGVQEEHSFGIANPGLVLEILRKKLYADPIATICREYAANARDAHREAGKPNLPIKIVLPSHLDSNLRVIDKGPGISPNRIADIFVKFAASTKRDDNTQTGGFGIGSKSGFAYTDQFSVITVYNGTKRSYAAYIDTTRVGKLSLMSEIPTDESNGTQIIIPVNTKDFNKFAESVEFATRWWDVQPEIVGNYTSRRPSDDNVVMKGNDWRVLKARNYYEDESIILVDGFAFKFADKIVESRHHDDVSYSMLFTGGKRIVLEFANGVLPLAANRESIHWEEDTIQLVTDRLDAVSKEIRSRFQSEIESCDSYVAASVKAEELTNAFHITKGVQGFFTWKGEEVYNRFTKCGANWPLYRSPSKRPMSLANVQRVKGRCFSFNVAEALNTLVVVNDINVATLSPKRALEIFNASSDDVTQLLMMPKEDFEHKEMAIFHKHISFRMLSDFMKATKTRNAGKARRVLYVSSGGEFSLTSISEFEKCSKKRLFVLLSRGWDKKYQPILSNYRVHSTIFTHLENKFDVKIYGFDKAQFDADPSDWEDVTDCAELLEDFIKENVLKDIDIDSLLSARKSWDSLDSDLIRSKFDTYSKLLAKVDDARFNRIVEIRKELSDKNRELDQINWAIPNEKKEQQVFASSDLNALWSDFIKDYPLFRQMYESVSFIDNDVLEELAEYVNLKYNARISASALATKNESV